MNSAESRVMRRYAKYIFLDVVQFSKRSAEAQSDIVQYLNEIVNQALSGQNVRKDEHCILIPTGDGMCIALISPELSYDVHMRVALSILELLEGYNKKTTDEARQFKVRIGINQNTDILVTDINERTNIAGAGINMASRVMDKADGSQILVSQTVFDELQPSEQYMNKFRGFVATAKHDIKFQVHQYINPDHVGLVVTPPSIFIKPSTEDKKLSEVAARYFALTVVHKRTLQAVTEGRSYLTFSAVVLLWYLAQDSCQGSPEDSTVKCKIRTHGGSQLGFAEQLKYYGNQDYCIITDLHDCIVREHLSAYYNCFEQTGYMKRYDIINAKGVSKVRQEWPGIWNTYGLD